MEIEKLFEDKDYADVIGCVQTLIEATTIISGRYNFYRVMIGINNLLEITEKLNSKSYTNDQKEYFNNCVIRGLIRIKEKIKEGYDINEEIHYMDMAIKKVERFKN